MTEPKKIFFDIDGVLTKEVEGYSEEAYMNRTPNMEVINIVNLFYDAPGYKITLFTARHTCDREITERWLRLWGVNYHELILGKPHYDILIDDMAMGFSNLPLDIINAISNL